MRKSLTFQVSTTADRTCENKTYEVEPRANLVRAKDSGFGGSDEVSSEYIIAGSTCLNMH